METNSISDKAERKEYTFQQFCNLIRNAKPNDLYGREIINIDKY
jgi:hypothetical protein